MKKLVLAVTAVAAFSGSALAADLSPHNYAKAPPPMVAQSWSGFYIFGGGGGGLWDAPSHAVTPSTGIVTTLDQKFGGDGIFGTVGAGYDWQFNNTWVAGVFADGQFGSIRGSIANPRIGNIGASGTEKLRTSYAAGVRLGYLVAPNVLSYVNAGYSGSEWSGVNYNFLGGSGPADRSTPSFRRDGFFFGGGVENNLNIFGISAPGWFMKTEYRAAYYDRIALQETAISTGLPVNDAITFQPLVQTISTSLVYRFNWTGPVVAKY